jgi:hypothetical protein
MEQKDIFKETFSRWRRSYLRLRMLERNFVSESRSGRDPARIAAMYDKVEAVRAATTALFHSAQTASMPHQIPSLRAGESTLS